MSGPEPHPGGFWKLSPGPLYVGISPEYAVFRLHQLRVTLGCLGLGQLPDLNKHVSTESANLWKQFVLLISRLEIFVHTIGE